MNRACATLLVGLAASGLAATAQAATPKACFWSYQIDASKVVGSQSATVETDRHDLYRLDTAAPCTAQAVLRAIGAYGAPPGRGVTVGPLCNDATVDLTATSRLNSRILAGLGPETQTCRVRVTKLR